MCIGGILFAVQENFASNLRTVLRNFIHISTFATVNFSCVPNFATFTEAENFHSIYGTAKKNKNRYGKM